MNPELLTWGIVFLLTFGFLGLSYNALQTVAHAEDFWVVRLWVILAAVPLLARSVVWGLQTHRPIGVRIVVGVIACGVLTTGTVEAMRYISRRHARWLDAQQSQSRSTLPSPAPTVAPVKEAKPSAPNLVDRGSRILRAHQNIWSQVLVEGPSDRSISTFDPDWEVLAIEICNEFRVTPKTDPIDNLTAEIKYTFPDGSDFKFNRGGWLGRRNRIGLGVNDSGYLIIVVSQMTYPPRQVRLFTKEYPNKQFIHLDSITGALPHGQDYSVEIKLISESKGESYGTLNYMLAVDKEGFLDFVRASDWNDFQAARASVVSEQGMNNETDVTG